MKTYLLIIYFLVCGFVSKAQDEEVRLGLPLGKTEVVSSAVFSPDGKIIATGSDDGMVKIWEVSSGRLLNYFQVGYATKVKLLEFSPDGSTIIATNQTNSLASAWQVSSGRTCFELIDHLSEISSVKYSPDGKLILTTANADNCAKVWDASNGKLLFNLSGNKEFVFPNCYRSLDGRTIMTAYKGTIEIRDYYTRGLLYSFKDYPNRTGSQVNSSDGKIAVEFSLDNRMINIWSQPDKKLLYELGGLTDIIDAAMFSPDGKMIVTTSRFDETVKVWDVSNGKLLHNLHGHSGAVRSSVFSPDGETVLTASYDSTAKIWNPTTGELLQSFDGHLNGLSSAVFSPNGKTVVTTSNDNDAKVWDCLSGNLLYTLPKYSAGIFSANFSQNGKYIVTESLESFCKIWNALTGEFLHGFPGHLITFIPDAEEAIVSNSWGGTEIVEACTGKLLHRISGSNATLSPDNKTVLTILKHAVNIWKIAQGKLLKSFEGNSSVAKHIVFSSDGKTIATAQINKQSNMLDTTNIFDLASGNLLQILEGYPISFSPDGKNIVTKSNIVTNSRPVSIRNIDSGELLYSLEAHHADLASKQKTILVHSHDSIKICEISDGNVLLCINKLDCWNYLFSPDEKTLLTISGKGILKMWNVTNGKFLHSIGENDEKKIHSAIYSSDNNCFATIDHKREAVEIRETITGVLLYEVTRYNSLINNIYFSLDGKHIVIIYYGGPPEIIELYTANQSVKLETDSPILSPLVFSPDGKSIVTASFNGLYVWSFLSGKLSYKISGNWNSESVIFSPNGSSFIVTNNVSGVNYNLQVSSSKPRYSFTGSSPTFSPDGKAIVTASVDGSIILWNASTGQKIVQQLVFDNNKLLTLLPTGYYQASKEAAKKLYYIKGLQTISPEQLDIKYNRPDKVLAALGETFGNPNYDLINAYHRAWQKRVERLGVDTTAFADNFSIPESDFKNRDDIAYEQQGDKLILRVWGKDKDYALDRFNVWINEVPLFGMKGISLRGRELNEIDTTLTIVLSAGDNKIETSVLNVNGIESYRLPLHVSHTPKENVKEKLYFVGIGVDEYEQPGHKLQWATKDIRNLAAALKERYGNDILIDTLLNSHVTLDNVLALKQRLLMSTENDKVIVSFSGHGLLSKDFDYYLATHNIDFSHPEISGLPYEQLEWLLDSIPARKKLLLIDACHSGEVDKSGLITGNEPINKPDNSKGIKIAFEYDEATTGMKNSFELMQELFANVNRGAGATVISAAGGTEFAHENGKLKNGVFTYSILEAMESSKEMTISKLKATVGQRVQELTNGMQKPTSRNETIEFDWRVW